jgi:hypothetical protein
MVISEDGAFQIEFFMEKQLNCANMFFWGDCEIITRWQSYVYQGGLIFWQPKVALSQQSKKDSDEGLDNKI